MLCDVAGNPLAVQAGMGVHDRWVEHSHVCFLPFWGLSTKNKPSASAVRMSIYGIFHGPGSPQGILNSVDSVSSLWTLDLLTETYLANFIVWLSRQENSAATVRIDRKHRNLSR